MRNVAGISQTEAQKSSDLYMKCRYLDELTGGKGIVFATGTPVSNSMTEIYTMQRYLQYNALVEKRLTNFDAWASTFGETVTAIELAPEGSGYRARTRFAKFFNLPELMCMFKEVADIKTIEMMPEIVRPKANFQTIVAKPSDIQKEMVDELSDRAAAVHNKSVEPHIDNMLKITSDGRKIGLDQRLMNPMLPDFEDSKVNKCVDNVYKIWEDNTAKKLTQLIFCDFSTPNKDGRFNVYDDIRSKLLDKGIPENEIAFIHDANTETRKKELFGKVRQGKVRVLFGSTAKLGAGTNVQDLLIALHDLDCPWRPRDLEQRAGRIVRQGNKNPEVNIYRYVTESSFDSYLYQTIENKQKFISQIMSSKSPVRSCEDVDESALSYAEIKALCAGNPNIREKMDLDIEVSRLKLLKADHQNQLYRLEDSILQYFPQQIEKTKAQIAGYEKDIKKLEENTNESDKGISPMVVNGKTFIERTEAGQAIIDLCKNITSGEPTKIGAYRGFDMYMAFDKFSSDYQVTLKGDMSYKINLGADASGNITRINNALQDIVNKLKTSEGQLENFNNQLKNAEEELKNPFPFEDDLKRKSERLAVLDSELNMDSGKMKKPKSNEIADAGGKKKSILQSLKENKAIINGQRVSSERDSAISL